MQTSLELLPVYNALYDLNLTDIDIQSISKTREFLQDTEFSKTIVNKNHRLTINGGNNYWSRDSQVNIHPIDDQAVEEVYFTNRRRLEGMKFYFDIDDLRIATCIHFWLKVLKKNKNYQLFSPCHYQKGNNNHMH